MATKPNILVIWGDDIGHDNISAYHRGLIGGSTANIDRIAKEGALFTDADNRIVMFSTTTVPRSSPGRRAATIHSRARRA